MSPSDLAGRSRALKRRLRDARQATESALAEGTATPALLGRLRSLEQEERTLLEAALPYARERLIASRQMGGRREVLCADASKAAESGLPDAVVTLVTERLGEDAELDEPDLPVPVEQADDGLRVQGVHLKGSLWCAVSDGTVCFAFTDEGAAYLLERNLTWRIAPEPLALECFPTRIVQESSSSCLFVDVDGALERLSYTRLDTVEALLGEQLYA